MLTPELFTSQLSELVTHKTVVDKPEEILRSFEYIRTLISPEAQVKMLNTSTSPILLAANRFTTHPDVAFLAHVDVVAGRDDQFVPQLKGDVLFGRGTSDMKFSIPLGIELLNQQIQSHSSVDFMLAITADEETGGFGGAAFLADEYQLKPDTLIVLDGGNNLQLVESSKGLLVLNIKGQGKPSHPCYPHLGDNPVDLVVTAASELLRMFPDKDPKGTTVYLESISGGNSTDRYSDTSQSEVVICHPANVDQAELLVNVTERLSQVSQGKAKVEVLATGQPVFTDTTDQRFRLFKQFLEEERGKPAVTIVQPGGSDARHFVESQPLVLMTKAHGGGIHGENEHVSVASSLILGRALEKFMREYKRNTGDKL